MKEILMLLYTLCIIGLIFNTLGGEKKTKKIKRILWIAIGMMLFIWFWSVLIMIDSWINP